jgi:putative SOS response-associated peptidase YedK
MPFAMAGLWDRWQSPDGSEILSCTIITTEANVLVKPIHERMPVILPSSDLQFWLEACEAEFARLNSLLQPYPATEMEAIAVSPIVNNPHQDRPECIQPV